MAVRKSMPGVIRKICLWCQGGTWRLVRECAHAHCPLHASRLAEDGDDAVLQGRVAAFCLTCAGSAEGVAECNADSPIGVQPPCPAHPYRVAGAALPPAPVQQVRFLPGLGAAPRPAEGPESGGGAVVEPGADPGTATRSRTGTGHEPLPDVYSGRAPEALDI